MDSGATRRDLLRRGVQIGLAGAAGAELLAAPPAAATAPAPAPDSESGRLERLLSVELLLLFVYEHVLASPILDARAQRTLTPLRAHEQAHVHALGARLSAFAGASAPAGPAGVDAADRDLARRKVSGRLGELRGARDALRLLLALERVTIGAYFVALTKLQTPALIRLAAEIMASDAQHEAVLGLLLHPGEGAMAVPYGLVQGVQ